jgi:hypothetical protein
MVSENASSEVGEGTFRYERRAHLEDEQVALGARE